MVNGDEQKANTSSHPGKTKIKLVISVTVIKVMVPNSFHCFHDTKSASKPKPSNLQV